MSGDGQKSVDTVQRSKDIAAKRQALDPCLKENEMTTQCMNENGYNGEMCKDFFENYRNCKKFWSWVMDQRKKQGIQPYLPPPEERESVKKEYLPLLLKK
ncbi:coiled-coil-helix-coiled-coil-helix domain-containing protein 7-like [Physella acuta]|uniref:coiled-coil-helix-coiled-coil-helix domain-containing protein 7-like n=1 Tax=Physella acuta TaxID=109671 RepID=UPI0027DBAD52|nr:coiled-coil-helix-coiled-coil-helix domain-containing protein 7-like [Physella acuta]